jgi:bacterial/archaeal transporter family protein
MWIVFAFLAAFTAGISVVLSKSGLKKVDPVLAFAIQSILIITISWGTVWVQGRSGGLGQIDKRAWLFLIGAGLATCLSSLFQFSALKSGNATIVAPLVQLSLVFSILFAILFLKEPINWKIIVGAVLMVAGAILISVSRKAA